MAMLDQHDHRRFRGRPVVGVVMAVMPMCMLRMHRLRMSVTDMMDRLRLVDDLMDYDLMDHHFVRHFDMVPMMAAMAVVIMAVLIMCRLSPAR
jgi:hypothetical protein